LIGLLLGKERGKKYINIEYEEIISRQGNSSRSLRTRESQSQRARSISP